jgi:NADH-quinone oxidoreductase subunit N
MITGFSELAVLWQGLFWVICVITMTVGNLAALRQKSMKRMLAYSSVAHAGYALMGFLAVPSADGASATVFYMFVYSLMTLASFGVVLLVTAGTDAQYSEDSIDSFAGLGRKSPFLAIVMAITLFSLAGMPPFAGFVGKLYLFKAAMQSGFVGLVIIAAINSVISLYYYLRVIVVMYFEDAESEDSLVGSLTETLAPRVVVFGSGLALLYFGLMSESALGAARWALNNL